MSVYVDPLGNFGWVMRGRVTKSCHMYADTEAELHVMAAAIGMKRAWFQKDASMPHYDLVPSRRAAAVALGAVEHCRHRLVNFMRQNGPPGLRDRGQLPLIHPCCGSDVAPQGENGQGAPEGATPDRPSLHP